MSIIARGYDGLPPKSAINSASAAATSGGSDSDACFERRRRGYSLIGGM